MNTTDQILQKLEPLPIVKDHLVIKKNNLITIKGNGYAIRIKVINDKEVILSKTWKLGIIGILFCKKRSVRMERLVETIFFTLEKSEIEIHYQMLARTINTFNLR